MVKRLALLIILFSSVGCASQSSVMVTGATPAQRIVKTQRLALWGIVESEKSWDPRGECPNGIAKVEVSNVISLLGFYGSYDVAVLCAATDRSSERDRSSGGSVIIVPR